MKNTIIVITVILMILTSFFLGFNSGANKVQSEHKNRAIYLMDNSIPSDLTNSEIEYILFGSSQE